MKKELEKLVLAIDIGGTYTKFGFVHPKRGIIEKARFSTTAIDNETTFIQMLAKEAEILQEKLSFPYKLEGIGIGTPGVVSKEGIVEKAANIPFLSNINLVELLKKEFHIPIVLSKDSNLAAIGEGAFGVAQQMNNYILLTLGTGLGCAVFVNGELLVGNSGLAGEFGHTIIKNNNRMCGCGRMGCLETYVSGKGIVRTVFELLANCIQESLLRTIPYNKMTPKLIYEMAQKNDSIAIQAFEQTGKILGEKIANLYTLFDPEAVILAGGLMDAKEFLMPVILKHVKKNALYFLKDKTNVFTSNLGANEAALLGAASLIWKRKKEVIV